MTFQSSYAKLLADPHFGEIKLRKEHMRQMYVEGMMHAASICLPDYPIQERLEMEIRAIAEESNGST